MPSVALILSTLSRSGGVGIALGHAARLVEEHGFELDVVCPQRPRTDEVGSAAGRRSLAEAANRRYDIAIATWWTSAWSLLDVPASHRTMLLQGFEPRFYRDGESSDRLAATAALCVPDSFVAVSDWLCGQVAAFRPGVRTYRASNGIDQAVFRPADRPREREGPLRVLIEGQPGLWFKGVTSALAAVEKMDEAVQTTVVALDEAPLERRANVRVLADLDPPQMAALYAESDVLVKLSRFDGLSLPPLEAFHVGTPCLTTPFGGHAEYVRHGVNGVVVGFDDQPAATRWLDRLARDRELLARLGDGALDTARTWPDLHDSTLALADALREMLQEQPYAPDPALRAMAQTVRRETEHLRRARGALEWNERALAQARDHLEELSASREDCAGMLEDARQRLEEVTASRGYRVETRARRLLGRS